MFPRQIETIATQHAQDLRSQRRASARRPESRAIRTRAGWTLIAVGLRLASSSAGR